MSESTKIEWCDSTFNPWIGCTKVSAACDHCYAEAQMDTRMGRVQWGSGKLRSRTSAAYWKQPLRWNAQDFRECGECGYRGVQFVSAPRGCPACGAPSSNWTPARRRVFCASLADVFDNEVDPAWRADLFELIQATPNLDWLLLTKRIGNVAAMAEFATSQIAGRSVIGCEYMRRHHKMVLHYVPWPLPNVWLGATICNQAEADRDIPKLLATPAAKRFLSIEPMLGLIDMERWLPAGSIAKRISTGEPIWIPNFYMVRCEKCGWTGSSHLLDYVSYGDDGQCYCPDCKAPSDTEVPGLDWIICGGESGPHARPMHPDWARSLRDQCAAAGVPFLFKQWGEWAPQIGAVDGWAIDDDQEISKFDHLEWENGAWSEVFRPMWCDFQDGNYDEEQTVSRIGKKRAGRLLDGAEHNGVPS